MKILPPISIEGRRLLPSRWDLLAAVLVLGFVVAFADASRFLVHPLSSITGKDLVLDPADLPFVAALRRRFDRLVVISLDPDRNRAADFPGVRVIVAPDADAVCAAWNLQVNA